MSSETKTSLEEFAARANWSASAVGNREDTDRFLDFIATAYRQGDDRIALDEFLAVINASKKDSAPEKLSARQRELSFKMFIFTKYEDGIKLLRKFERK